MKRNSMTRFALPMLLVACAPACHQQLPSVQEEPEVLASLPEGALADDRQLKELGDLGPAPLQVEPARPFSGSSYTIALDVDGGESGLLSSSGDGCGGELDMQVDIPIHLDGVAGAQGPCGFVALVDMEDGTTQRFTTGFEVHATDPEPLPMEVLGGVYSFEPIPEASSVGPSVEEIAGPSSFVNGGSLGWSVAYSSGRPLDAVLVSLAGYPGHYRVPLQNAADEVSLELRFPPDAFAWMSGARLAELDVEIALVDESGGVSPISSEPVEGTPVGSGDVGVAISWSGGADVDLHVTEPSGETIFYGNRESQSGGRLDLDSNPTCDVDGVNAEHIFWPSSDSPGGAYEARVHLYDPCSEAAATGTLTVTTCGGGETQTYPFSLTAASPELTVSFEANCGGTTVSGRIRYEDFAQSSSGLSSTGAYVPARYVTVQAVAVEGEAVVASGSTDRTGRYSLDIPVDDLDAADPRVRIRVVAQASNARVRQRVTRGGDHVYRWLHPDMVDPTEEPNAERSLEVSGGSSGGALNQWDVGVDGFALLHSLGLNLPAITWRWREGSQYGSYAAGDTIYTAGSNSDPDEYDDFVLAHEMGHVAMFLLSESDSPGGAHSPWDRVSPALAWGEGWASYFGSTVLRSGRYIDTRHGGVAVNYSIESLPSSIPLGTRSGNFSGSISEAVVSAVLWDMHDTTNESKDTLSGLNGPHWKVLTGYLGEDTDEYDGGRGAGGRDLMDFLDGWLCHHGDAYNGSDDSKGLRGNVKGIHQVPYDFPDYECS
ncbi:MAG TPA: hypothetical protein DIU15_02155 [Deltaproteobacteria bacterium]|nr:hypothetical protein [Deltaproteobacteria bacterium]HCP44821.1 hypothetical protein [Deltaproteobacteria bacterium]